MRDELHDQGIEIVTVALDTAGIEAAKPFIEAAKPTHPALVDQAHLLGCLFGIVNVPSWIWIDEEGTIVRPPEPAWPGKSMLREMLPKSLPDTLPPYLVETLGETRKIRVDPKLYPDVLRDWVARGDASEYALSPDEVLKRSRPRPVEVGLAAAHFELGQHLWRAGNQAGAETHFREAHRLQPENWTYKRQAWIFAHPLQGPTDVYDSDWVSDVRRFGAENYYPAFEA